MNTNNFIAIVLGAGNGTRMKSSKPKVMHEIANLPMVQHIQYLLEEIDCPKKIFVSSPDMQDTRDYLTNFDHAVQAQALGTGHAVLSAADHIDGKTDILVLYGDTPLITKETIESMITARKSYDLVVLGMHPEDPAQYGRLIMDNGNLKRIVEFKEATEAELEITFCNSGIVLISGKHALEMLQKIDNKNAKDEYYLTDIIEIANQKGLKATAVVGDEQELIGVNSCIELAEAEYIFQTRQRHKFLDKGITLRDPETTYFSYDTKIDGGCIIEPNVFFGPQVTIEKDVTIKANSYLEGCHIKPNVSIGPFARIRPGAEISENAKIGNFVEIKKSKIGKGSKVSHLSYIGDSILGENVNIGAGTITCNYDGYNKYKTVLEDGVFIGSNSSLVAPLTVGKNAIVGAGSSITKNINEDEIGITRSEQKNIKDGARRFRKTKERK